MEPKPRHRARPRIHHRFFSPLSCRYNCQSSIVDHVFPPVKSGDIDSPTINQEFSSFAYWRDPIQIDLIATEVALPKQEIVEVIAEKVEEESRENRERKSSETSEKSDKGSSESKEDDPKSQTERKEDQDKVMQVTAEPSSSSSSTTRSS